MTKSLMAALVLAAATSAACSDEAASPTGPTSQTPVASNPGSSPSGGTGAPAGCSLPARPNNLRVTSAQGTVVELTWDPVPTATSYTLLVGAIAGNSEILNESTTQTSFRFTGRDGQQFGRVQANSACGGGQTSAYVAFTLRP